ncbi:hypothetical protein Tco_1290367, partial [Tanacetum coccineum]
NSMDHKNIVAISHDEKDELKKKGIKSQSKFDTEEDYTSSTNAHEHELDDMKRRSEGIKEHGKEDDEIETDIEVEEVIEDEESEFETNEEVKEVFEDILDPRSFAYECDFMILEDTSSIIDRHLGEMVFGKPFIDETGLAYDKEKGTVMFKQGNEKITFTMTYTIGVFKQAWLMGLSTDSIPPSAHKENFGHGKMH